VLAGFCEFGFDEHLFDEKIDEVGDRSEKERPAANEALAL